MMFVVHSSQGTKANWQSGWLRRLPLMYFESTC
jgi:hypothetical protein